MELREIVFKHKGKEFKGDVACPENLEEAVSLFGAEATLKYMLEGYIEAQKKIIRDRKVRKRVVLEIKNLTEDQKTQLRTMGIKL